MKPVNGVDARLVEEEYLIPVTGDGDEDEDSDATHEGAAVSENDAETQGETASDEVNGEVTPQPDFSETLKKYQNDINKMKSSFQKRETELRNEKSVLEQKLDSLLTSTMDDKDRQKYEFDKMQEKVKTLQAERDQMAQQAQQMTQFIQWKTFFDESGVEPSKLDLQNGLESLTQSGLAAMRDKIKTLESKVQGGASKPAPTQKSAKNPPEVAQSTTGKVPTLGSLDQAIEHFAKGDEEKFWRMAETGNQSVLKVLNELNEQ